MSIIGTRPEQIPLNQFLGKLAFLDQLPATTNGTVTSVGGTGTVSGLTLTGTVTSTGNLTLGGTLAVTPTNFASQVANTVLIAPNGAAGVPTFRTLVAADIPALAYLTSYTETDTLQTVTGRGASSNVATLTLSASTASTTTGTGTLVVTGGVGIGGNLNVGGTLLVAADPTVSLQVATKGYVDGLISGLAWKNEVRVATTANITLSAPQTIDGIAVVAGDRVLVKDQTTTSQNGIYVVAAGAWTRATDADAAIELNLAAVFVLLGTVGASSAWTQTATVATIGTDAVTFVQFNGTANITAGAGLTKSGNTLSIATITQSTGATFAKITLNTTGQVTGNTAVVKADLTGLGVADDTLVVHLAGTETISGSKTFSADTNITRTDAQTRLYISNTTSTVARFPNLTVENFNNGFNTGFPVIELISNRGVLATPVAVASGDILGGFNTWGRGTSAQLSATRIQGIAEAAFTTTATAGLGFYTTNAGTQAQTAYLNGAGNFSVTGNISLVDNKNLFIGTGNDLYMIHDGTNTSIVNQTGNLTISNNTAGAGLVLQASNTTGSNFELWAAAAYLDATTSYIRSQNGASTFAFFNSTGLNVTGTIVASSTVSGTSLTSTVATGTAPLTVASTTVVANLNADMLDGLHASSFANYGTNGGLITGTFTASGTTQQVALSLASATYRTVEYTIQATLGTAYSSTKLLVIHDGTNTTVTEYGTINTGAALSSLITADILTGNIRLLVTPVTTATVYKIIAQAITI